MFSSANTSFLLLIIELEPSSSLWIRSFAELAAPQPKKRRKPRGGDTGLSDGHIRGRGRQHCWGQRMSSI